MTSCLQKYDTLIFDMDGVITSEQNYWDIAALTVYEMTADRNYFGDGKLDLAYAYSHIGAIRAEMFDHDRLIVLLKERGVNSNWDLAYLVFCFLASGGFANAADISQFIASHPMMFAFELYSYAAEAIAAKLRLLPQQAQRNGDIWQTCRMVFQEWYLGAEQFQEMFHRAPVRRDKKDMTQREIPIVELDDLRGLLEELRENGKRLCIGTGRPKFEIDAPLAQWQIRSYFDENGIIDYDMVMRAERDVAQSGREVQLTKPHPYMFLKALFGADYDDEKLLRGDYDKTRIARTLVIGDAGADILAAKAMGADFAAVLTGINGGTTANRYFAEKGAAYILPDVRSLLNCE